MKSLIKMISLMLLCTAFINPMVAMEEGEVPATSTHTSQMSNAASIDNVTDHRDMFDYLCDHCTICLEENLDDIVILRKCGHRFHRNCIGRFLNTGTRAATKVCPQCRGAHERRSLIALIGLKGIECDSTTIEGVSAKVIRHYQEIMRGYTQITRKIFYCLSVDGLHQVHDFFAQTPTPARDHSFKKFIMTAGSLCKKMFSGISITKKMIRNTLAPLHYSSTYQEAEVEIQKRERSLNILLDKLLRRQDETALAETLKCKFEKLCRFTQDNKAALSKLDLEVLINEFNKVLSSENALLTTVQNGVDFFNSFGDEVILQEVGLLYLRNLIIDLCNQFPPQHPDYLRAQELLDQLQQDDWIQKFIADLIRRYLELKG